MREVVEYDNRKLYMSRDKHLINIYSPKHDKIVRYNLRSMRMEKKDKNGDWYAVKHIYSFFQCYSIQDIEYEEEKFKDMIKKTAELNPKCRSVSSFVARMKDALVYENYVDEDIKAQCYLGYRGHKRILTKPLNFYNKIMIRFFKEYDIEVTTDIEKEFVNYYKFYDKLISILLISDADNENKKIFFESIIYYSYPFRELVNTHNYNMLATYNYIVGYLLPFENLQIRESISLLNDYYSMANSIGRDVKKYPKYIKSMHDIIMANYAAYKQEYDELQFEGLIKTELEHKGKNYSIVVPKCSKDIISEGTSLNHCVSSYVNKILKQQTYIMFLRKTNKIDASLITLEFQDNKILNAKGSYNRPMNEEEQEFINEYCRKKRIECTVK